MFHCIIVITQVTIFKDETNHTRFHLTNSHPTQYSSMVYSHGSDTVVRILHTLKLYEQRKSRVAQTEIKQHNINWTSCDSQQWHSIKLWHAILAHDSHSWLSSTDYLHGCNNTIVESRLHPWWVIHNEYLLAFVVKKNLVGILWLLCMSYPVAT